MIHVEKFVLFVAAPIVFISSLIEAIVLPIVKATIGER